MTSLPETSSSPWGYSPMKRAQIVSTVVLIIVAVMLLGLAGRVAWLEKHVTQEQVRKLQSQHVASIPVMPTRGVILAADGTPFATSVRMYNMFVDPTFVLDPSGKGLQKAKFEAELKTLPAGDARAVVIKQKLARFTAPAADEQRDLDLAREVMAEELSPLMQVPAGAIELAIEENQFFKREVSPGVWEDTDKPRRFLWLKKEVDEKFHDDFLKLRVDLKAKAKEKTSAAEEAKLLARTRVLDGIGFVKSMRRVYPMGQLGGYLVGRANLDGGTDALEFQLEPLLRGIPGRMYVTKDAQRRTLDVDSQRYLAPDDGRSIWMTIDPMIQAIAEEELATNCEKFRAESGCAIIMDPHTGKILAMASWPPFNPADANRTVAGATNQCINGVYEPGSIFKPFIVAWGLDKGLIKVSDVFNGRQRRMDRSDRPGCQGRARLRRVQRGRVDHQVQQLLPGADRLADGDPGVVRRGDGLRVRPADRDRVAGGPARAGAAAEPVEQRDQDEREFRVRSGRDAAATGAGVWRVCQRRLAGHATGDRGGGRQAESCGAVGGCGGGAGGEADHQRQDGADDAGDHGRRLQREAARDGQGEGVGPVPAVRQDGDGAPGDPRRGGTMRAISTTRASWWAAR